MSRMECTGCKCVFQDVVKVRRCPLCGGIEFSDADLPRSFQNGKDRLRFPRWFTREGIHGFYYTKISRFDRNAEL